MKKIIIVACLLIVSISMQAQSKKKTVTFRVQKPVIEVNEETEVEIVEMEEETIFFVVEEPPQFPGGEGELSKFLANNVQYPEIARENDIQGRVYVQFVIDENGKIGRAKVIRGVHPALDNAALQVVNKMPKWTPGKQRGKAVKSSYTLPVNFFAR